MAPFVNDSSLSASPVSSQDLELFERLLVDELTVFGLLPHLRRLVLSVADCQLLSFVSPVAPAPLPSWQEALRSTAAVEDSELVSASGRLLAGESLYVEVSFLRPDTLVPAKPPLPVNMIIMVEPEDLEGYAPFVLDAGDPSVLATCLLLESAMELTVHEVAEMVAKSSPLFMEHPLWAHRLEDPFGCRLFPAWHPAGYDPTVVFP